MYSTLINYHNRFLGLVSLKNLPKQENQELFKSLENLILSFQLKLF